MEWCVKQGKKVEVTEAQETQFEDVHILEAQRTIRKTWEVKNYKADGFK